VAEATSGLGALVITEVEHVELGRFRARELRPRVERRQIRLGVGGRFGVRLSLGRLRPVVVEVHEGARDDEVAIPAVADPWVTSVRRTLMLCAAALALGWWVDRRRARASGHDRLWPVRRVRRARSRGTCARGHPPRDRVQTEVPIENAEAMRELAQVLERAPASHCFGTAVSAGDRTVIPVAEVTYGVGFGWGSGGPPDAGGGGAGGRARGSR